MIVQKDIITLSMLKVILIVKAGAPTNQPFDELFNEKRLKEILSSL
jgi:hypothetical protein